MDVWETWIACGILDNFIGLPVRLSPSMSTVMWFPSSNRWGGAVKQRLKMMLILIFVIGSWGSADARCRIPRRCLPRCVSQSTCCPVAPSCNQCPSAYGYSPWMAECKTAANDCICGRYKFAQMNGYNAYYATKCSTGAACELDGNFPGVPNSAACTLDPNGNYICPSDCCMTIGGMRSYKTSANGATSDDCRHADDLQLTDRHDYDFSVVSTVASAPYSVQDKYAANKHLVSFKTRAGGPVIYARLFVIVVSVNTGSSTIAYKPFCIGVEIKPPPGTESVTDKGVLTPNPRQKRVIRIRHTAGGDDAEFHVVTLADLTT